MKVLCVVPRGLSGKGGIEQVFRYAASGDAFERRGFSVTYFASRGAAAGITWVIGFPFRVVSYTLRLVFCRIELVEINLSIHASAYRKLVLFYIARLLRRPIVIHFHGGGFEHMIDNRSLATRIILHLFRRADRLVVLGAKLRDIFSAASGRPIERIDIVHNGITDFGKCARVPRVTGSRLRLLFAGELGPRKGTDILIEALWHLNAEFQDWTCVIAGNGDVTAVRSAVHARGLHCKVEIPGWINMEQLQQLMLETDIVVLPSRGEGLPVSLIEGACAGAALIASDAGASGEVVVSGQNGFIVPVNAAALAAAIVVLAKDRPRLSAMQVASRSIYCERFTSEVMIASLTSIYSELSLTRS